MAPSAEQSQEARALKAVLMYERARGGDPKRVSQGTGYDVRSRKRKIEIKSIRRFRGGFVRLTPRQFRELCNEKRFFIYLVDLSTHTPRVFEFSRDEILRRITAHIHYDLNFSKTELKTKAKT